MPVAKSLSAAEIHSALDRLAHSIAERHGPPTKLVLLGIANGGITVARRLAARLGCRNVGILDISFHRDDIGRNPIPKEFVPTVIPLDINGATVVIVDDVLSRGARSRPPSTNSSTTVVPKPSNSPSSSTAVAAGFRCNPITWAFSFQRTKRRRSW